MTHEWIKDSKRETRGAADDYRSPSTARPKPRATVSTPVTWDEVEAGIRIEDFTIANVPERVRRIGDLWSPLLSNANRFALDTML